ncbi:MAG: hypothetical protein ACR2QM_19105, partial [Longimicrobiales bacterium]
MTRRCIFGLLMVIAAVSPVEATAQSVALRYWLTPKPESSHEVEAALTEFTEWLRQEGEPWRWSVFRVIVGDQSGSWVLRSGGHTWQEFDERGPGLGPRSWSRFEASVLPLLESATLQVEQTNETLTSRPEQGGGTTVFHITEWDLEPEGAVAFQQAVTSIMESHEQAGA